MARKPPDPDPVAPAGPDSPSSSAAKTAIWIAVTTSPRLRVLIVCARSEAAAQEAAAQIAGANGWTWDEHQGWALERLDPATCGSRAYE